MHATYFSWLLSPLSLLLIIPSLVRAATSAEYTNDDAFRKSILNVTNTYRKQHNATGLEWNETLADFAGSWSGGCKFGHSVSLSFVVGEVGVVWEG